MNLDEFLRDYLADGDAELEVGDGEVVDGEVEGRDYVDVEIDVDQLADRVVLEEGGTLRFADGNSLIQLMEIIGARSTRNSYWSRERRNKPSQFWFPEVKEPKPAGLELLHSGDFGRADIYSRIRNGRTSLYDTLTRRQLSSRRFPKEDIARPLIPNSSGAVVAQYQSNVYAGQFSDDSSFYYTCCQDFNIHVYDMTAPTINAVAHPLYPTVNASRLKERNVIQGVPGSWTITDSHLSPDNERIIYATMSPSVHMANVNDPAAPQVEIPFAADSYYPAGIWSCRFSADGNEIIAGGRESIYVFDLLSMRRTVAIDAHDDDVNSCCWADAASGNVLVSASDDSFLKVWDRRSLGSGSKPAGVFVGHTEGVTHVSAKGDGRYLISNGKDQTLRLWDMRNMMSSGGFDGMPKRNYGILHYDYRYYDYPEPRHTAHPNDNSVMVYTGHRVLRTLIRCYFSPSETTGGSYIYSGSADGKIHIWSLDGRIAQVIDRSQALPIAFDPSDQDLAPLPNTTRSYGKVCVRDVSWHSEQPVLMSCAWDDSDAYRSRGSVAMHEWKGFGKNALSVEDVVEREALEQWAGMPGSWDI